MTIQELYKFAGVSNIRELHKIYCEEDQRLMKSGDWDYDNPLLLTNFIRRELEWAPDAELLTDEEDEWRKEILWFWHHHATSCAIWKKKDKPAAKMHVFTALFYQGINHPNKITRLLSLLVLDLPEGAIRWSQEITDEAEKETAASLIKEYQEGKFF